MRYKLKISVINILGTFQGYTITDDTLSREQLVELKDTLQSNTINHLTLRESLLEDSKETLFNAKTLEASILTFKIEEFPDV